MAYQTVSVLVFLLAMLISSTNSFHGGVSKVLTVSLKGDGKFTTIQEAVNSVPDYCSSKTVILIHAGVYREKVIVPKQKINVIFQGQSYLNTIIAWNNTAHPKKGTPSSASVAIFALNFTALNISFQNTAIPVGNSDKRAVALNVDADQAAFYGCGFYSVQDTLLDYSGRHFYKECFIQGEVDFIFGDGRSLFEDCTLNIIANANSHGISGVIAAQGRASPDTRTGFSFVNCRIVGTGNAWLGRAWQPYSTVAFIKTNMSNVICSEGWNDFNDKTRQRTVFFGEYGCFGPGADYTRRVPYSKQLSFTEASPFMNISYIQGDSWLPILTKT